MKQKFNVTGMTCSACSAHVEKAVRQVEGVDSVSVNLLGNSMLVEYGGKTGPEQIIQAVTDAGYGASLPGPAGRPPGRPARRRHGGGAGRDEAPLPHVLSVSGAPVLHRHGAHDGLAPARLLPPAVQRPGGGLPPVPAHPAHPVYQPQILYGGLQDPVAPRAQHGLTHRPGLLRRGALRRGGPVPHRLAPGPGGLWRGRRGRRAGPGGTLGHGSLL
ncbi:MAG: heavy-metal-associated domain-containing protein [Flavonifractor plautii]